MPRHHSPWTTFPVSLAQRIQMLCFLGLFFFALPNLPLSNNIFSVALAKRPLPQIYEFTIHKATIKPTKPNGRAWDVGLGRSRLPDVFLILEAAGQRLQTPVQPNTLEPYWQQKQIFALQPNDYVHLRLYDRDVHRMELIGETSLLVSQLSAQTDLSFGQVESLSLNVVRLTLPKQRKEPPPPIPPQPRGKLIILPERTTTPKPPERPKQPPAPRKTSFVIQEEASNLRVLGLLRYRQIQAKIRVHTSTQSLLLSSPSKLTAFSITSGKKIWEKKSHKIQVSNLIFLPHTSQVLLGFSGGTLPLPHLQDISIPSEIHLLHFPKMDVSPPQKLAPFFGDAHTLAYNEETQQIAWSDAQGQLYTTALDRSPLRAVALYKLPEPPLSLAYSPNGKLLWWSSHQHPPQAIDLSDAKHATKPSPLLSKSHAALALTTHKNILAWCTPMGHFAWYKQTPPSLSQKELHNAPCLALFPHPTQKAWWIIFPQKLILLSNLTSSTPSSLLPQEVDFSTDPALDATRTRDGKSLFTLHQSGHIRRWRLQAQTVPASTATKQ